MTPEQIKLDFERWRADFDRHVTRSENRLVIKVGLMMVYFAGLIVLCR